jgi:hypothetical protein
MSCKMFDCLGLVRLMFHLLCKKVRTCAHRADQLLVKSIVCKISGFISCLFEIARIAFGPKACGTGFTERLP